MSTIDPPRRAAGAREPSGDGAAGDQTVVLRLNGEFDVVRCRGLDQRLRDRTGFTVVDLSGVTLLSAAAIGVLIAHTARLASGGGCLAVVPGTANTRRLLTATGADGVLDLYDRVADAVAAFPPGPRPHGAGHGAAGAWRDVDVRGGEDHNLRRRLRTQPTVARALGVLQERYGLRDPDTAFGLLRMSSQDHNLRLHVLAAAVLTAPAPAEAGADRWFPGRRRQPGPPLTFADRLAPQEANRTSVLDAVLDAVCACTATEAAELRTADVQPDELYLERHRGLPAELLDLVERDPAAFGTPAAALRRRTRVVVPDVSADPVVDDPAARAVLLAAGSRALQSSPLLTASGGPVGVVTTHHRQPGRVPTGAEHARLDRITAEAGAWLDWHRRTVVLDALEQVHESARRPRR